MNNLLLMLLAVLAGCASAKQVKGPNGEIAYLVQCGNAVKDKCTEKAGDLCPNGYDSTTTMLIQCK